MYIHVPVPQNCTHKEKKNSNERIKEMVREFPGSPMVGTPCGWDWWGWRFKPWGTKILQATQHGQKKKGGGEISTSKMTQYKIKKIDDHRTGENICKLSTWSKSLESRKYKEFV